MFLLFGSGEKVTTIQPENRQEQDVIFYFKISAFARFQVMFQISASAIPPSHARITCIHRCSIYSCVAAGPAFGKQFRGPWFIRLASESHPESLRQSSYRHLVRQRTMLVAAPHQVAKMASALAWIEPSGSNSNLLRVGYREKWIQLKSTSASVLEGNTLLRWSTPSA